MDIQTGFDFEQFMTKLNYKNLDEGWYLKRSPKRNKQFKVKGISIAGTLTNEVVGKLLNNDDNLLIILEGETDYMSESLLDAIELLYLNEIYVFCLGYSWLFNVVEGMKLIAGVLSGTSETVSNFLKNKGILLGYNNPITIKGIFQRFQEPLIWNRIHDLNVKKISNLLYIPNIEHLSWISNIEGNTDIILTNTLSSELIDFVVNNNNILIWLHKNEILNETARDLTYYFSRYFEIKVNFLDIRIKKIKYGLDGI